MSKTTSKKNDKILNNGLLQKFAQADFSDFPDFHSFKKPLEMALWVLWVSKDLLGIKQLKPEEIAHIIRETEEISITEKSIIYSLNRAGKKVHVHRKNGEVYFEIMKPGKDHLTSQIKTGAINVFYFEPGKRYTSKRTLATKILVDLKGEMKVLDPYCGERTLDIFKDLKNRSVKFLTQLKNLGGNAKTIFLRELKDFKSENPNIEFRDYPHKDIHDRYVISSDRLVILGHSIKNLGEKESFAIVLKKDNHNNISEALSENFSKRWDESNPI